MSRKSKRAHSVQPIAYRDRSRFYSELYLEVSGILEETWFTNLANTSAILMSHLPTLNWVGFYLTSGKNLLLGPFQGAPACIKIPFGKGVCGTAASDRDVVLVDDVEQFAGHIVCDVRSKSELVIPLVKGKRILGVLDLDSPQLARFDERDVAGLAPIVQLLVQKTKWPKKFD